MIEVECRTAAEAEKAIADGNTPVLIGSFELSVSASIRIVCKEGSPTIHSYGSSAPRMVSYDSSAPTMVSHDSSAPTMVSYDSSAPRMVSYDSSAPTITATGCTQLRVRGSMSIVAAATVAIVVLGGNPTIEGGGFIQRPDRSTPEKW